MRSREMVLTYKEENGFFIQVKCEVRMFCRPLGIYTKFLLLAANSQTCNTEHSPQHFIFFLKNVIYYIYLIGMDF